MPSVVALLNYITSGLLWRIFCQTETFRGVYSPYIYHLQNAGGISAAAIGRGRGHYTVFSAWFFCILFAERISEAAMGRKGVWGHNMINYMTIRELYHTFADFFQNWNFSL